MKDFINKLLKNKLNLTLAIVQIIAILFLCLGSLWEFAYILAIIGEGVFFILLGVRMLVVNKEIKKQESMLQSLPMQKEDVETMAKRNVRIVKSNKFQAFLYIVMGLLLIGLSVF